MLLTIDKQYIDFDSTLPPEFKSFWRNKTETKYLRLVSTYLHFLGESNFFSGVLKFSLLSLFFDISTPPGPPAVKKGVIPRP